MNRFSFASSTVVTSRLDANYILVQECRVRILYDGDVSDQKQDRDEEEGRGEETGLSDMAVRQGNKQGRKRRRESR